MREAVKKTFWIIRIAAVILAVVAGSGLLLLQTPYVQTLITGKVAAYLSDNLIGADISFEKIHLKPFNTLIIKNAVIIDKTPFIVDTSAIINNTIGNETDEEKILAKEILAKFDKIGTAPVDTFFKAEHIIAKFSLKGLTGKNGIDIGSALVSNGQFNLVLEDGKYSTNLTRIFRISKSDKKKEKKDKDIFHIKDIRTENLRFTMKNYTADGRTVSQDGGIDWDDLDVSDINISGRNLKLRGKIMTGKLDCLSFKEKSGYICYSLSGQTRTGNGAAIIEDIRLSDPWSEVSVPLYVMRYNSIKDFSDYIHKVRMEGQIARSRLGIGTLHYFAPVLQGSSLCLDVEGSMAGCVDDFEFNNLSFSSTDGRLGGNANGRIKGLPNISGTSVDVKVSDLRFTTYAIENLIGQWTEGKKPHIAKYAPGIRFRLNAVAKGPVNALRLNAALHSLAGDAKANVTFTNLVSKRHPAGIEGEFTTKDFNLNSVMASIPIKECSIRANIDGHLSPSGPSSNRHLSGKNAIQDESAQLNINSLYIDRMNFNGYDYGSIAAAGKLSENKFDGKVICSDPNLNFLFQGIFTLSSKTNNALYSFYANIGHADLNALNFDKRGKSRIRFRTNANFNRIGKAEMLGTIDIADLTVENAFDSHKIGDIRISSQSGEGQHRLRLSSGFAEGIFTGSGSIGDFINDIAEITLKKEVPALFPDNSGQYSGNDYKLSFKTFDTRDLLSYLMPGLYIADNTTVALSVDRSGTLEGNMKSKRIAFKEQYLKDIEVKVDNFEDNFGGEIFSESMNVATLTMKNNSLKIFADDNHVGIGFTYDNQDEAENRGEVVAFADIDRDEKGEVEYKLGLFPSSVYLNTEEWNIYPSKAIIKGNDISIENMEFRNGEQSITARGGFSENRSDSLTVNFESFNLSAFNPLLGKATRISGAVTGEAMVTSPKSSRGMLVNLICYNSEICGEPLGDISIGSVWNDDFKRFDLSLFNDKDGKRTIDAAGYFHPASKRLEARFKADSMSVSYAQPFLTDIFSEMDGSISADITAEGPIDNLNIRSDNGKLNDVGLRIAYTNVKYTADGPFRIDNHGVHFDDISVSDRYGNKGRIYGGLYYDNFRNMRLDMNAGVGKIEAVDIDEKNSEYFYGHLFASGNLSITGPLSAVMLNANVTTAGDGNIHIPLSSSATAGTGNLLTFKEYGPEEEIDPYEEMMTRIKSREKKSSDFGINLHVNATNSTEAFIEIDKASGNVLNGKGEGSIDLDIRPSNNVFDIRGDYTISSGNYKFVALGLVSRDFSIDDGSSIKFNGDIMESTLDINATYRTKASLSTLIADTTSVNNKRLVDCGIGISGELRNPRLKFSIDIPDIDPMIKSRVESALSTEDKVQKQFLSLILSNSFLPDEQSGIVNNSSMLYSNVSEIMANQLNNIFQKLDIPIDLGLSYQPNEHGNDIFDVAVSTQLFNNRVIVNGNIGNRQYRSSNANSDVVGDLDIEIKINRPGTFRLNLFSHSTDQYTNYIDNSQRNGIGVTYQQEFSKFGQFIRNIFTGKKKREAAQIEEIRERMNEEKVIINIDRDQNIRENKNGKR